MASAKDVFRGDQFCVVFIHIVSWVVSVPENVSTYFRDCLLYLEKCWSTSCANNYLSGIARNWTILEKFEIVYFLTYFAMFTLSAEVRKCTCRSIWSSAQ